jgi:flavodoxin
MADYDVIYLGYPNWWGTFPMAVFTFLESYDFSNKTIVPFCTHEGSGMGKSERDIEKLCPYAKILPGIAIRGSSVAGAGNLLHSWLS